MQFGDAVERVFLGLVAEDIAFEIKQLLFDAPLFPCHGRVVGTILCQSAPKHIGGLVNLSTVSVEREIVVGTHGGAVVDVACHDGMFAQERSHIVVLHPEERIFRCSLAEIILPHHDGAQCDDLAMEGGSALVIIGALLEVIAFHLS